MKKFACGDVVPGCDATFESSIEDAILAQVAERAAAVHGLEVVPPSLPRQVRASLTDSA